MLSYISLQEILKYFIEITLYLVKVCNQTLISLLSLNCYSLKNMVRV